MQWTAIEANSLDAANPAHGSRTPARVRVFLAIMAGWLLVALAWSVAVHMVQDRGEHPISWTAGALSMVLTTLPWMLATPWMLRLGERFPVSRPHLTRNILIHLVFAMLLIPGLEAMGEALELALLAPADRSWDIFVHALTINALFAVPTYVAVIGIGHAMAWLHRYEVRERELARMQLTALRTQLNPHFLFNTLNAVTAAGYRDPALADHILTRLAELLRASLAFEAKTIPLSEEVAFLRGYLEIHQLLLEGQLDLDLRVQPGIWHAQIPPMLLQPLVENAIMHGAVACEGHGMVRIEARCEDDRLRVLIENDLPNTAAPPTRRHVPPSQGIGLRNTRDRLRVLYGRAWSLVLETTDGGRAVLDLRIPLRREWSDS